MWTPQAILYFFLKPILYFFLKPKLLTAIEAEKKAEEVLAKKQKEFEREQAKRTKEREKVLSNERKVVKEETKRQIAIVSALIAYSINQGHKNVTHHMGYNQTFYLPESRPTIVAAVLAFLHERKYKADVISHADSPYYIFQIAWGSDIKPNKPESKPNDIC